MGKALWSLYADNIQGKLGDLGMTPEEWAETFQRTPEIFKLLVNVLLETPVDKIKVSDFDSVERSALEALIRCHQTEIGEAKKKIIEDALKRKTG